MTIVRKDSLAKIFNALSSMERVHALELFGQNKELKEIAKLVGMSRSGFQKVVEAFRELGLVERAGHRSWYKLSRKGEKVLEMVKEFEKKMEPIEKEIAIESIKKITYGSGLTAEDIERLLEELKTSKGC
jgi:predicted transcriptional regulator